MLPIVAAAKISLTSTVVGCFGLISAREFNVGRDGGQRDSKNPRQARREGTRKRLA